jgi:hypothetical protein
LHAGYHTDVALLRRIVKHLLLVVILLVILVLLDHRRLPSLNGWHAPRLVLPTFVTCKGIVTFKYLDSRKVLQAIHQVGAETLHREDWRRGGRMMVVDDARCQGMKM